jgi:prepilin-type N-terminal cleavage/methylation domain-containing protein
MKTRFKSAFTLVEIMVVVGIVGLVSLGLTSFYVESMKSGYASEQQMSLITTMRSVMNEMVFNGSRSHELILYNSAAAADITAAGRKIVTNEATDDTTDDICPTGDFAVFVYYELPKPSSVPKYRIAKLIGYYLNTIDSGPPQLVRITFDLSASPSTDTVETILINNWNSATKRVIAARVNPLALTVLSDGVTATTTPQLFYKRANQNIAVCGQLFQSATKTNTKDARTFTRTFYFSVTVRS